MPKLLSEMKCANCGKGIGLLGHYNTISGKAYCSSCQDPYYNHIGLREDDLPDFRKSSAPFWISVAATVVICALIVVVAFAKWGSGG